jgi:tRNA(adenine34) deaminase
MPLYIKLKILVEIGWNLILYKYLTHEEKMLVAYNEAVIAFQEDEVPIGAAAFLNNTLISKNHNRVIQNNDPTAHSELLVLQETALKINNYRLTDIEIYTTVEPCIMCFGGMIHSRIYKLVYGTNNLKWGFNKFLNAHNFNHKVLIVKNIMKNESKNIIENYFKNKRR